MNKELLRSEIDEKYKWDLTKFFINDDEWQKHLYELKKLLPKIENFKGKLNDKYELKKFLILFENLEEKIEKLYIYSSNKLSTNMSNSKYIEMDSLLTPLLTQFNEITSFYTPEMLSYSEEYLQSLINDTEFSDYDFSFKLLLRERKHTLSENEEKLLSLTSLFADDYQDLMLTYMSVDLKIDDVMDENGNLQPLNETNYYNYLINPNRDVRKNAYLKYSTAIKNINTTIGKNFISSLKKDSFYSKARNYEDTLSNALYSDNMTKKVYHELINNAHSRLDIVARYYKAKRKALNLEDLELCDRLCSMVADNNEKYDFEKCCDILRKALLPLGEEYIKVFNQAIKERWFDVFPNKGKRGGAYQSDIYGFTPLILLNHTNNFDSLSTIAHEFGHAMHSFITQKHQCREKANYTIFCAEIASTTNEVLLNEYFLNNTQDKKERLFYLDDLVNKFIGTFFRQTMFAEFEEYAHDLVDYAKPISPEILNTKYEELNSLYLPSMKIDDLIKYSWISIPHFYNAFYVWKYATGIVCAINFASSILDGKPNALENYKKFLTSGGSDFSLEILKKSGIDLETFTPYEIAFNFIDKRLKELEEIINE